MAGSRTLPVDALTHLETLIRTQQPAKAAWAPVTDYTDEGRRRIEGKNPALILEHLTQDGDEVLDFGCGPAQHLVRLLKEADDDRTITVFGYDPQIPASKRFIAYDSTYELVICREVLEHLTLKELVRTARKLCALSTRYVYVTTRFAKSPAHLLSVDESDDLDPTHITMVTQDFLRLLFVLEGFTRRADLEAKMDWMKKGRCLVYERV